MKNASPKKGLATGRLSKSRSGPKATIKSKRQRAEEKTASAQALKNSEVRYRRLFEAAQDGILILDVRTGAIDDVNPFLIDMLGYSRAEFVKKKLWEVGAFKDVAASKVAFNVLQEKGYIRYENLPLRAKGGQLIQVEFVSNVYLAGGKIVIQCSIRNITERKREEEMIKGLARFPDENPYPILRLNEKGIILYANTASQAVLDDWKVTSGQEAPSFWRKKVAEVLANRSNQILEISMGARILSFVVVPIIEANYVNLYGQDITERKRGERAMIDNEERFRATFEQAAVGIAQVGIDGSWLRVNQRLCDIVGYTREELLGLTFQDITHPDDLLADEEYVSQMLADKIKTYSMEKRYIRKDRNIVWINLTVSLVRGPSGEPKYFISVVENITEKKRAEERIAYQAQLLDNVNDAIVGSDEEFRITAWNASAESMYGWKQEEVLGRSGLDFLQTEWPQEDADEMRRKIASIGRWRGEASQKRKDGTWFPVEISSIVLHDESGKITGYLSVNRDISERKQSESAIRKMQALLNETQEISKIGGWEYDVAAERVFWTDEVYRIHGVSKEYDPGNPGQDIKFYLAEDQRKIDEAFRCAVEEGTPYDLELQLKNTAGEILWVRTIGRIENKDGKVVRVLGNIADITERKRAEAEIHQLNAELELRVVQRTAELIAANKELEAFSYSVSHDLRAPLRAIDGFSHILLEDFAAQLPAESKRYLDLIRANTQQMGELVDDLLAFSRLSRQPLNKQTVAPADIVHRALADLHSEQEGRQVEIVVGDLPVCEGDPALLKQVFVNLLANALKFTRTRDVAHIEVGSAEMDGVRVYFVRDNGVGFDMQYIGKLFGVFQRLHRAEDYEGTGVGLAIVQRIVNRHGGRAWAEAEVDRGATFYFTI